MLWKIKWFKNIHELQNFVNVYDDEIDEFKIIPIKPYGDCYLMLREKDSETKCKCKPFNIGG